MKTEAKGVSPEVVAAISAAVQMMTSNQVIAVRIKRSDVWAMSARGGLAKPF
ncbi:MAG: methylmalonyl-CoA carboxyltransferase [Selenomonas sp.]|jgi:methylmalonyl-CoA carboxyltransferase large subunit|nr:methylmalonyl-CoA carboxyltransferase [Selenomonas sp.]